LVIFTERGMRLGNAIEGVGMGVRGFSLHVHAQDFPQCSAIVVNQYGRGRAIYVGGSLEAQYVATRVVSLQRMLSSMVRYLRADAPMPFSLAAPRGVYGILRRASGGDLVLWICANVGFKDATVGRMRQDFLPVPNVVARVLVPEGRQLKSVELLRANQTAGFTMEGAYAVITLPAVHIAEVLHLRFA
ncbi:MAG: hypothetical protein ABSG32_26760, partial [Terriglobia bacterium]